MSLSALLIYAIAQGATCTAIANGNWESAGTWSCGAVPTCGDVVDIPAGKVVTVTTVYTYACLGGITVEIEGELNFNNGKKLELPAGSIVSVNVGGSIVPGGGGGNSNLISIGGTNVWTAGSGSVTTPTVLPIALLRFNAIYNAPKVDLSWSTATEVTNKLFTIQKSVDGVIWQAFDSIAGAGTSTVEHNYTAFDDNPNKGINYYRLVQIDYDGNSTYQGISIAYANIIYQGVKVIPNPVKNNCVITFSDNVSESTNLVIYDYTGREVLTKSVYAVKGDNAVQLDVSTLANGMYFTSLPINGSLTNAKLIKR